LVAVLFGLAIVPPVAAAGGATWPQVGGDVRHSGANLLEREIGKCNADSLELRWQQALPRAPQGAPTVVDGRVYTGTESGWLYALDAGTGKVIWSKPIGGRIATPVVEGDRIYVVAGTNSSAGSVSALAVSDGRDIWRSPVNANGHQSPVVGAGLVVISSNRLYAFDQASGRYLWQHGDEFGVAYEPAIVDDLVIAADDGSLVALRPDGSTAWEVQSGVGYSGYRLRVSADGGVVYAGGFEGLVRAFDTATGSQRWQARTYGEVFAPAIAGGLVFAQASTNFVYAIDQATGAFRWSHDTTDGGTPPRQTSNFPPTYANGMIFVSTGIVEASGASAENWLLGLDAKTGAKISKTSLGRERATQPTVAGGLVYVQTENRLLAFGLPPKSLVTNPRVVGRNWMFLPVTNLGRPPCVE
jgi:outer membrane protein assembly factor BamB